MNMPDKISEGINQIDILHTLKRAGYMTVKEYLSYRTLKCEIPEHKGIFGRVNTGGVPAMAKNEWGAWKPSGGWRGNPYNFLGKPDIEGFTNWLRGCPLDAPKHFVIEVKASGKKLKPHQELYRKWFELSGGLYILADNVEVVEQMLC